MGTINSRPLRSTGDAGASTGDMAIRRARDYLPSTPRSRKARTMMTNTESKVGSAAMASVIGMASFAVWSSLAGLLGVLA